MLSINIPPYVFTVIRMYNSIVDSITYFAAIYNIKQAPAING